MSYIGSHAAAQAFQSLVRYLLGKSDAELSGWRDALVEALAQLENVSRLHDSPFLALSRRIVSLTASLDEEVRSALDCP